MLFNNFLLLNEKKVFVSKMVVEVFCDLDFA